MKTLFLAGALFLAGLAGATELFVGWSPSPGAPAGTRYVLYVSTNAITSRTNALYRSDVGTNTQGSVAGLTTGTWYFYAAAYIQPEVESDLSQPLIGQIPAAPQNMKTVVLQYSTTLTNWSNAGFFRVQILP